jgi:threonine dehydratase
MKTPQPTFTELNKTLGLDIYLKREDEHKYSSHKGRSIPLMIKKYVKEEDITNFVISSSGNAAIAAIHTIQAHNKNNDKNLTLKNCFIKIFYTSL